MALQSLTAVTGCAPQGGSGGWTVIPTLSLCWPCRTGQSRQGRSSVLCGKELGFSGEQCQGDEGSDSDSGEGSVPYILGAFSSSKCSCWLWQLILPGTGAACSPQCPVSPLGTLPGWLEGQCQVFGHTQWHTCVCWCVGRAGLAAAGHSDVPRPAAPPRPCCPPRPAILGREARMGTGFLRFKVSRGAVRTHRPFVQPPRVPPAVILLKFVCDLRSLCLVGEDPC